MSTIIAFLATFAVLIIGVGIVMYVFSALGLYTMAGNRGIEYKWIAWIHLYSIPRFPAIVYSPSAAKTYMTIQTPKMRMAKVAIKAIIVLISTP